MPFYSEKAQLFRFSFFFLRLPVQLTLPLSRQRTSELIFIASPMKHVLKLFSLLVVISALWIGLLQASIIPRSHTWLLPIYFIVSLGCYGLLMVGVGLMRFPTCPQEALLLQQDIAEAKDFLKQKGVDVGSD
ncbi:hypothetical protein V6N12_016772 [Hibiscus sabdariffa]|uniref:Dolichol-phosphate mannosyltransferase subunit 3 n=1 Tax=Hibiscus sabdariffa TaxID=183260 RepID=A0ABR2CEM7_9ROSI